MIAFNPEFEVITVTPIFLWTVVFYESSCHIENLIWAQHTVFVEPGNFSSTCNNENNLDIGYQTYYIDHPSLQ